jgi:DNA-binding winged helix-turn-helix (wHTH) protein
MQPSPAPPIQLRFATFEFNLAAAELRKRGRWVPLQDQPLKVLALLLQHPGELVTREELQRVLWLGDTFGEFDEGLNKAIQKLRHALRDSADNPRFIETIPRKGYRFIAPVELIRRETSAGLHNVTAPAPQRSRRLIWIAAAVTIMIAGGLVTFALRTPLAEPPENVVPLTTYPGIAGDPTFSPDGGQVAFSWNGEKQDNTDIYVKLVGSGAPLRLTTNLAEDNSPAWSPDGRQIAFLRSSGDAAQELLLISPLGGVERKLADLRRGVNAQWWSAPAWTPDSKFLAVRDDTAIVLVSVEGGEKRKLTSPPAGWVGDWLAAISPDGGTLAFSRVRNGPTADIFLAPVSDGARSRRLTHDNRGIEGLAWTPDGKEIVFSSSRAGDATLWRISASGGTPERLPAVGAKAVQPAIAVQGRRAAFVLR